VLAAARDAFAAGGEATSLEEIARRAGVGIGTLYRHFPNRQALVEALYVTEVEDLSRSAEQIDGLDPWEALNSLPAGVLVRFAAAGVREVIVELIVAVTTSTALQVRAELDRGVCWVAGPGLTG